MFVFEINDTMWFLILKLCSFKLLWIWLFVVLCITAFLMVFHTYDTEELKNSILNDNWSPKKAETTEKHENVGEKIKILAKTLSEKKHTLKESQLQMNSAENALNNIEYVSHDSVRDRYKSLLSDLKNDLKRTESEVQMLQSEVDKLSRRRQNLKNDLLNQQTNYQKMLDAFSKELEVDKNEIVPYARRN